GGEGDWLPTSIPDCYGYGIGRRTDGHNLVADAIDAGYEYGCTPATFAGLTPGYHRFIGLFAFGQMGWPYNPTLAAMTDTALDSLSTDPEGFFLMVEGSQIDLAAHANNGMKVIDDVKTFDDAVQVAVDFATTNPDTLLIVVADHETGGLSLLRPESSCSTGEGPFPIYGSLETFCTDFSTENHTNADVPLTAKGPDSGYLSGTHENTEIFITMFRYLHSFYFAYLPALLRQ
ncbi:MAG: alkaline phosphatase, partial [Anaerolineaceae bacterium]